MERPHSLGQTVEPTMKNCLKHAFIQTFKQFTAVSNCTDVYTARSHLTEFQTSLADLRNLLAILEEQANDHFDELSSQDTLADNGASDEEAGTSSGINSRQNVVDWLRASSPTLSDSGSLLPIVELQSSSSSTPSVPATNVNVNSSLAVTYSSQSPLVAGEMIACEVTASLSPFEFYIVPDASRSDLNQVEYQLRVLAETLSAVRIEKDELSVGMACCCYWNGELLRAEVLHIGLEDAQLRLIDSGVGRFVPLDQIFPMPAFLAQLPPVAHLCAIAHVDSRKLDAQTVDHFDTLLASHSSRFIVKAVGKKRRFGDSERELVDLFDQHSLVNLSLPYHIQSNGKNAVSSRKWPKT
uniref:Tudor domain-containing protein n=1 Tax=Plectus sambesii TaxID=2011161 RepID=A0A914W0E1_9BILA